MKKKIFLLICLFSFYINIEAKSINVELDNCIDGDTAKFIYEDNIIKARFLAIDTPEINSPNNIEPFGEEAAKYTCDRLMSANNIVLEFDEKADERDKYGRYLVWVFVDDSLLQSELVSKGYAKVTYLYNEYKYNKEIKEIEDIAKNNKKGIWSINLDNNNKEIKIDYKEIIMLIGIFIIYFLFNSFSKNKKVTKK